jgi:predicted RNA-binding protein with PIN domain
MRYLVDGHNLIPNLPGLSLQNMDDEQELIQRLLSFCQAGSHQVEVFFDRGAPGYEGARRFGRVTAHFVRSGQTADAAISRRLHSLGRGARQWCVVSSDRSVQAAARASRAQVMHSAAFAQRLEQTRPAPRPDEAEPGLTTEEVEEWLRIFGSAPKKSPPKNREP